MRISRVIISTVAILTLAFSCQARKLETVSTKGFETPTKDLVDKATKKQDSDLSGVWYMIDYSGKFHKENFLEISKDERKTTILKVHGDFVFPGCTSVVGTIETSGKAYPDFTMVLVGKYPDGRAVELPLELSIVKDSSYARMTGAISLNDPNTPDGVELGRFQHDDGSNAKAQ